MKKLLVACLFSGLALVGCSTTSVFEPKTSVSNFDGSKGITVTPHGAACKTMMCPMIGASWIDKYPNTVGLKVDVLEVIANIDSVSFNIDGEIITLKNNEFTEFSSSGLRSSGKVFMTDYSIIGKILNSKRTWMKVSTSKGPFEVAIIDGQTDSKAYHALKKFDEKVRLQH